MQGMTKTLSELFAMLKTIEFEIKKEHDVFMVSRTVEFKRPGRKDKPVVTPPKARNPGPKSSVECFYCKG